MHPELKTVCSFILSLFAGVPAPAAEPQPIAGQASYYHKKYIGKKMANDRPYDPNKLTMATYEFPLGAKVRIDYTSERGALRSVIVEVTDRGPAEYLRKQGRLFDLSWIAFRTLENPRLGVIPVRVTLLDNAQ